MAVDPALIATTPRPIDLAWEDIRDSFLNWRIWLLLAYQDIKLRYRRSILGPFWITLSMAITTYTTGYLYSHLFHTHVSEYFPYLVAGMLGWSLISTVIIDLVETFPVAEHLIKQIKLPYTLYLHRVITRNIIIFLHNIFVIVPVLIIFHEQVRFNLAILWLIPGLGIIYLNSLFYGITLSMLGARYRDISQLIRNLVQVVFFMTPIMWKMDILPPDKRFIALYNPIYSLIEMIRAPLLGYLPSLFNFIVVGGITLGGMVSSYYLFTSRRGRIIYWL